MERSHVFWDQLERHQTKVGGGLKMQVWGLESFKEFVTKRKPSAYV